MTETDLHKALKNIGRAFLFNQRCFIVATEVWLTRIEQIDFDVENKRRSIIDVCGFGEKYIPYDTRNYIETPTQKDGQNITMHDYTQTQYKYNVIRGIEVKVSKNDLNNGFIASGCNYHYLLVPEELSLPNIPKHVGILTVNRDNFKSTFSPARNKFSFEGLKLVRPPKFREIKAWQIDSLLAQISARCARELISSTAEYLNSISFKR